MSKKNQVGRREKILDAATRLFLAQGVIGTQMKEVAKLADVDQSLIGYYFPSLDSLFAEVMQTRIQRFNDYVLDAVSSQKRSVRGLLEIYTLSFFRWFSENPEEARLIEYFIYLAMLREPFTSTHESFRRKGRERLAGYVFQGIAQGEFRKSAKGKKKVDGEKIARQIQGVIMGGLQTYLAERGIDPLAYAQEAFEVIEEIIENL